MSGIPVVLDMDPGVDDALALMMALNSPELEVLAVCTVSGNVPIEVATNNGISILGMLGRLDIPVYRGAERPLKRESVHAAEVHGSGGLGDTELPIPDVEPSGSVTEFLGKILSERPGEVTVIAVGPLTNLARAESKRRGILQKAKQLVVMGGSIREPGNVSPTAEFNFYADPDAARAVVRSGVELTLVPLDATHQVQIGRSELDRWVDGKDFAEAHFVRGSMEPALAYTDRIYGKASFCLHDPMAVGCVLRPSIFQTTRTSIDVEVEGELANGQVVADLRPFVDGRRRKGVSINWVTDVDADAFKAMFKDRVLPE